MTTFEEKVNAYRENKRLIEELEAMNDAIKADIIGMMHGAPEMVQGTAKAIYKDDFGCETYIDETGTIWKYTEPGPMPRERHDTLFTASGNDKDGEPESPMSNNMQYKIIGNISEANTK